MALDGVFERQPGLRGAAIELGASWVPGMLRNVDHAFRSFSKFEPALQELTLLPSEYLRRQVRFTPFPFEDTAWLLEQCGPDLFMFSTDYPHPEGGRRPFEAFGDGVALRRVDPRAVLLATGPSSSASPEATTTMTTARPTALTVEPVAGELGATVTGINLAGVSEAAQLDDLRRALADNLVVFLPEQDLSLDDLERVTDLLGGRDVTPFVDPLEDRPYVIRVIKEPTDVLNFANAWHSDLSYLPAPPAYTLLHAWDVPDHGGDTVWSNQYLAYETLSSGLKATLDGLHAVHSAGTAHGTGGLLDQFKDLTSMAIAPSEEAFAEHVHPVVIVHPVTGQRRALYVNPVYTTRSAGWTKDESAALLAHLHRHSINENFTCRLRWSVRTLAVWDNRCTMHNALNDYSGVRREMPAPA